MQAYKKLQDVLDRPFTMDVYNVQWRTDGSLVVYYEWNQNVIASLNP
jgi:hypothetical protein